MRCIILMICPRGKKMEGLKWNQIRLIMDDDGDECMNFW